MSIWTTLQCECTPKYMNRAHSCALCSNGHQTCAEVQKPRTQHINPDVSGRSLQQNWIKHLRYSWEEWSGLRAVMWPHSGLCLFVGQFLNCPTNKNGCTRIYQAHWQVEAESRRVSANIPPSCSGCPNFDISPGDRLSWLGFSVFSPFAPTKY